MTFVSGGLRVLLKTYRLYKYTLSLYLIFKITISFFQQYCSLQIWSYTQKSKLRSIGKSTEKSVHFLMLRKSSLLKNRLHFAPDRLRSLYVISQWCDVDLMEFRSNLSSAISYNNFKNGAKFPFSS